MRAQASIASIVVACSLLGCSGVAKLPPVDLSRPGWTQWTGQAVWRSGADRPAVAGDVVLARNEAGDVFVHFSKSPFTIFTARTSDSRWMLDLIDRGRSYAGRGEPPRRFVWFRVPGILAGEPPPRGWEVSSREAGRFVLTHEGRDESIRLVLDP